VKSLKLIDTIIQKYRAVFSNSHQQTKSLHFISYEYRKGKGDLQSASNLGDLITTLEQQACHKLVTGNEHLVHWKVWLERRFHATGVSKLRRAGQIRLAKPFHPAREAILSMMKQ